MRLRVLPSAGWPPTVYAIKNIAASACGSSAGSYFSFKAPSASRGQAKRLVSRAARITLRNARPAACTAQPLPPGGAACGAAFHPRPAVLQAPAVQRLDNSVLACGHAQGLAGLQEHVTCGFATCAVGPIVQRHPGPAFGNAQRGWRMGREADSGAWCQGAHVRGGRAGCRKSQYGSGDRKSVV